MIVTIDKLLSAEERTGIMQSLASAEFVSGKETAGHRAADVKNNLQLPREGPLARELGQTVLQAMARSRGLYSAVLPQRVYPPIFNRYEPGMAYGAHTDNALMRSGTLAVRTDVAVTLFLSDPGTYDGGELVIQSPGGESRVKLPAGSLLAYPGNSLHRVEPVTRGVRLAAVTWVQSLVREAERRAVLFDLDMTVYRLNQRIPEAEEIENLVNCYHRLLRMWAEP